MNREKIFIPLVLVSHIFLGIFALYSIYPQGARQVYSGYTELGTKQANKAMWDPHCKITITPLAHGERGNLLVQENSPTPLNSPVARLAARSCRTLFVEPEARHEFSFPPLTVRIKYHIISGAGFI